MNTAAIIASTGRPETLHQTLEGLLLRQSSPPQVIVASTIKPEDVDGRSLELKGCRFVTGARGLTCQLNLALDNLPSGVDLVLVCDDDVELSNRYLENLQGLFSAEEKLVAAAGTTLLDGATSTVEVTRDMARSLLVDFDNDITAHHSDGAGYEETDNLYGCHFVLKAEALFAERFDEALPLYSLYFEADICRRLSRRGRIIRTGAVGAAHLASKAGRMSGMRMGYSQVVNTYHLWRKGTIYGGEFLRMIPQAITANALKSITGDQAVDRPGRLRGNLLGVWDLLHGKASPARILDMQA